MAGHSKWAQIKRKKAKTDVAKGKVFTKLIREITIAARRGGGDPDANPRLRLAIQTAKASNMPADNIQRGIKKGAGELDGQAIEEYTYEGYGPAGVALLIDVVSDNRNRTAAEVRHALHKHGGNLGETGCVAWNFDIKGVVRVGGEALDEDTVMNAALDAGGEDVQREEDEFVVLAAPADLASLSDGLRSRNIPVVSAEVEKLPRTFVKLDGDDARRMLRLMDVLEELDDVLSVSANFDIPDDVLEEQE